MGRFLLHARQVPDGQAAGGLGGTIAPGIGGSQVASATAPVDDSGLAIDPDLANAPIPTVPVVATQPTSPIITTTDSDTPLSSGSSSDSAGSSASKSNNTTTIVIVAVAAVAFLLIGVAILVLFYRSNKKKRRQSRRGHWREIESHQSHGGQGPVSGAHLPPRPDSHYYGHSQEQFQPHPEGGMFETKSLYSTRRSVDAPPSLKLSFPTDEPLMTNNPFVHTPSPGSPVPPLPNMPTVQQVQQPQQIMVQHQADPPSAGFSAPSEYTASYIRSVYSTTGDVQSITESTHSGGTHSRPRSRSNTLKRGPDRSKNQHELIALDNLIAALDLTEEKAQTLPDPALFRAALGGQQQQQTPPQQHSQQPQQYY